MDLFEIILVLALIAFFASAAMLVAMAVTVAYGCVTSRRRRKATGRAPRSERRIRGER